VTWTFFDVPEMTRLTSSGRATAQSLSTSSGRKLPGSGDDWSSNSRTGVMGEYTEETGIDDDDSDDDDDEDEDEGGEGSDDEGSVDSVEGEKGFTLFPSCVLVREAGLFTPAGVVKPSPPRIDVDILLEDRVGEIPL
jgi:hypothetical protein